MNPVLILTHNCLELTKRCIDSVHAQDIPTEIFIFDNCSTDGTRDWLLHNLDLNSCLVSANLGVSAGWNIMLNSIFNSEHEHCLVINNDVILAPWTYRMLLDQGLPFVTGISVDSMSQIEVPPGVGDPTPHPDFSCFLITSGAWEIIGPFNEEMKFYASDLDYHVRAHRAGLELYKVNLPFYHERSSTLKRSSAEERAEIEAQANADREVFRSIYGSLPGSMEYEELFR